MNLEQAIAAMREGKKVRSVNWAKHHYIFMEKQIKVHTIFRLADTIVYIIKDSMGDEFPRIQEYLSDPFELYEEPKPEEDEIKVGDYVEVDHFNEIANPFIVEMLDDNYLIIKSYTLTRPNSDEPYLCRLEKQYCKKISPPPTIELCDCMNSSCRSCFAYGMGFLPDFYFQTSLKKKFMNTNFTKEKIHGEGLSYPIKYTTHPKPPLSKYCRYCNSDTHGEDDKHDYKVGDKVWVKGMVESTPRWKDNDARIDIDLKHSDLYVTTISELKPRGEDDA